MSAPEGLEIVSTPTGRRAVVRSSWSPEHLRYLRQNPVEELELNQGKGWRGADVAFLADLPDLRVLELIDLTVRDIEGIHALHQLRELVALTYSRSEIRLLEFPHLESCSIEWGKRRVESLNECRTLKFLSVGHLPGEDLSSLARLGNLESLWITTSTIRNVKGVEGLQALRELHLRGLSRLDSLDGIEALGELEEFELHTCRRISSIRQLAGLERLRVLHLNNCGRIDSLAPLAGLGGLEELLFYESTNILDGDMRPLVRLSQLRLLAFQNRRHYTHRAEDFRAFTEARHA